jgi:hypothetical protein
LIDIELAVRRQCACVSARSSKSAVIMPAPTAQPQRCASSAVGRMSGIAKRLFGRFEHEAMRAVGELEQLAIGDERVAEILTPPRCASKSRSHRRG